MLGDRLSDIKKYLYSLTIPPKRGTRIDTVKKILTTIVVKHMLLPDSVCPICKKSFKRIKKHIVKHRHVLDFIDSTIENINVRCITKKKQKNKKRMKVKICPICKKEYRYAYDCSEHIVLEHLQHVVKSLLEMLDDS